VTALICDVAIVGAGPTGLTLANILGQIGIRTVLVERNRGTVQEPRAVSIDDESLRTMQGIGLVDAVIKNVALDYGSHYLTPGGKRFATVEPSTREYGFPRRNAFTQPKLEATLREGLGRFEMVTALFEYSCDMIEECEDGVLACLSGVGDARVDIKARYLVGCDGARSVIRKHIGSTLSGSTYDQRWLIVDLASTRERLRQTRVVCNPARPFLTLPGPSGIRRYEFMLHDNETDEVATDPQFVRDLLAASGPDADAPVVRRQVYTFHARVADRWRSGRIFLAGDAAHLSPPFAGQGMNSGIRDAQNLGWKLAAVVRGEIGPGLLDSYQSERAPHARALIQLAINMGRVMMPTSRLQAWLVQAAFRLTRLAPRIQAYFAQMKYKPKPFYQSGFVVADDSGLRIAGRMVPQLRVETEDRRLVLLDDLLGQGFSLIAYGRDAQAVLASAADLDFGIADLRKVAILPGDYNADPDAPAVGRYARDVANAFRPFLPPTQDVLLLIRPDRYIAAAVVADRATLAAMAGNVRDLIGRAGHTETGGKSASNSPSSSPEIHLARA
jgi:3-(3-hydroxy-phenyl)propionate hydroxylase